MLSTYDLIGFLAARDLARAEKFHASKWSRIESPAGNVLSLPEHAGVGA